MSYDENFVECYHFSFKYEIPERYNFSKKFLESILNKSYETLSIKQKNAFFNIIIGGFKPEPRYAYSYSGSESYRNQEEDNYYSGDMPAYGWCNM